MEKIPQFEEPVSSEEMPEKAAFDEELNIPDLKQRLSDEDKKTFEALQAWRIRNKKPEVSKEPQGKKKFGSAPITDYSAYVADPDSGFDDAIEKVHRMVEMKKQIKAVKDFPELMLALQNGIFDFEENKLIPYEELKSQIKASVGAGDEKYVTRKYGLREKVKQLIAQ